MNETYKQFSEQIKAELAAALQSDAMQKAIAAMKAATDDAGSFEVVISTADRDRQGEVVDQNGWELDFYRTNPIVLWAHDYCSLPIGMADTIEVKDGKLVAHGHFAPEAANPFAQQVRRLYDLKIVRATSVGFIPKETDGENIMKAELLEFSFVPVPANPFALSLAKAQELGFDTATLAMKGLTFSNETKAAVPYTDHGTAPEDEAWDAAKVEAAVWGDGTNQKKYAEIHAWYDGSANDEDEDGLPDIKGAYKLPHHNADLKANWKGVAAAIGALLGARGGVDIPDGDRKAVYDHLAKHYAEFEKEPPEFKQEPQEGDACTMENGETGVMMPDKDGNLMCMPKPAKTEHKDDAQKVGAELEALQSEVSASIVQHAKKILAAIQGEPQQPQQESMKIGRVLSEKNRKAVEAAITSLEQTIAALKELLKATEPQGNESEERSQSEGGTKQRSKAAGSSDDFDSFIAARDILRAADLAIGDGLESLKKRIKERNQSKK